MNLRHGILSLLFPRMCPCCGAVLMSGENIMCLNCLTDMPLTGYHLKADFNPLMQRLMLHPRLERAAAWFHYERRSPYARLIHEAKYNGKSQLAEMLGEQYAAAIAPSGFFDGIDALVPVPLSALKLIRRGYNQSMHIAVGIARATGIDVVNALQARVHSTQTRKDAYRRRAAVSGVYSAKQPLPVAGAAHILLVDDIITTGATITACAEALHKAEPAARLSALALAATRLG